MPYSDDDYDKQCEEEEILFVDGGLVRHEDDEVYIPSNREDIIYDSPIVKKDLIKVIEACENIPCYYKEYLTLLKTIGAVMTFKEYAYLMYGFWPQNVDYNFFKRRN